MKRSGLFSARLGSARPRISTSCYQLFFLPCPYESNGISLSEAVSLVLRFAGRRPDWLLSLTRIKQLESAILMNFCWEAVELWRGWWMGKQLIILSKPENAKWECSWRRVGKSELCPLAMCPWVHCFNSLGIVPCFQTEIVPVELLHRVSSKTWLPGGHRFPLLLSPLATSLVSLLFFFPPPLSYKLTNAQPEACPWLSWTLLSCLLHFRLKNMAIPMLNFSSKLISISALCSLIHSPTTVAFT